MDPVIRQLWLEYIGSPLAHRNNTNNAEFILRSSTAPEGTAVGSSDWLPAQDVNCPRSRARFTDPSRRLFPGCEWALDVEHFQARTLK